MFAVALIAVGGVPSVSRADEAATRGDPAPAMLLSGPVEHGGFGGPTLGYTSVNGDPALVMGGRGGWLINHRLVLGGGGVGVTNRLAVPAGSTPADADHQLTFGYGGFWAEYIVFPNQLVHGSVGMLVGGGGITYHRFRGQGPAADDENDAVFVFEPGVSVELNVIRFMRVALFANYRIVSGVDLAGLDNAAISGFSAGTMLKFGVF
jgi:hypothetical protein